MKTYNPSKKALQTAVDLMPVFPELVKHAEDGHSFRNWYRDAFEAIDRVSKSIGHDRTRFACALSALSPRVAVRRNVSLLQQLIDSPSQVVGLESTFNKAHDCLFGDGSTYREMLDIGATLGKPSGMKTGSFARNLLGDEYAVTLDVWMARALGVDAEKLFGSRPLYFAGSVLVRQAAIVTGMTPAQCQAAIWHSVAFKSGRLVMGDFGQLLGEYFSC